METIYSKELVEQVVAELGITDLSRATIGQVVLLAVRLQELTGIKFIRMDQGVPGLDPNVIGREAEKAALDTHCAAMYPAAEGIPPLKNESSRFIKAFLDIDIPAKCCIPVVGSVQGSYGSFIAVNQLDAEKDTVLFIDPGFPIQKSQLRIMGGKWEAFDIFEFRGEKLRSKLESYLAKGNISSIIYSNPNNPAWICLDESELQIIGELATKYDVIVLEDLAYFCMDFRKDLSRPFQKPFAASVARYTDNYILMLSGSKIFSYAGQRIGILAIGEKLFNTKYPLLAERYGTSGLFGQTLSASILYMITSGATHTTQFALAAMMRAASDGELNFVEETREYERRAARMKQIFEANGFYVVYDEDVNEKVGDGFFFTIGYPGMTSGELMRELIYYGISSITLTTTGSEREGIRACCSRMKPERFGVLEERLRKFRENH
ncbi:Aspartate aminotransferase [Mucinivorans hirudinis]|uniref:Aspartate aminotransferase n=1 Tax=Mucinivorans hirudinis TaxID=1433126 RepID=A0A060RD57_9BACT|nr:Aspartate aminotransferase [Mucinivorans hirudinis]